MIFTALSGVGGIIRRWWKSNSFWHLLRALPALVVMILVGYVVAGLATTSVKSATYEEAAKNAFVDEQYEAADIYYKRLIGLDGGRDETLYGMAAVTAKLGDVTQTQAIMVRLAPLDSTGYGPAHLWQARSILANASSFEDLSRAEAHLVHVIRTRSSVTDEARVLLADLYMKIGQPADAVMHLDKIVDRRPRFYLKLARAHTLLADRNQAFRYGRMAQEFFQEQCEANPTDITRRMNYAEATNFLEDYPRAVDILHKGISLNDDRQLHAAAAAVYIAWADSLAREPEIDFVEQFRLLSEAMKHNPTETQLFQRLMRVLHEGGKVGNGARAFLVERIASGEETALVHLLLGTDAGDRGLDKEAMKHLEMALKLDPNMAVAANNLAWHLANTNPPKLKLAHSLVTNLATRWPEYAHFRDTRGQILAKMGRYEEALADLQAALPQLNEYEPLHRCLAKVYRELKMDSLAVKHESIASTLPPLGNGKKE